VEAAGIEPALETDTSSTLSEQKPYTNHTLEMACEELIDAFHTLSGQNPDTFLHVVCEICVKWSKLPPSVRRVLDEWDSLSDDVKKRFEKLARDMRCDKTPVG